MMPSRTTPDKKIYKPGGAALPGFLCVFTKLTIAVLTICDLSAIIHINHIGKIY